MKKFWTVLPLCAAMLCTSAFAAAFPDLPEEHWAYSAVDKMHSDGRVNGFPDGEFKPDELVTRWQFAKMAGGDPDAMRYPDRPATRDEAAEYLWERAGKPAEVAPAAVTRTSDNPDAIAWAYARGVMKGDDGFNLRLDSTLTRAEAATMIVRCEGELGHIGFKDTVSSDILRIVWDDLRTGIAYDEAKTLTNGQIASIAVRIGTEADTPSYVNLKKLPSFDGEYAKAIQLVAEECIGEDKANKEYMDKTATVQDAAAMLSFYAMRQKTGALSFGSDTYTDADITEKNAKMALQFARKNNVLLYSEPYLGAKNEVTVKDAACLLLQLDEVVGLTHAYGDEHNTRFLKQTYPYPKNAADYAYILDEVPVSVYETPMSAEAKPADFNQFGEDFAATFAGFLSQISEKFPSSVKFGWSFYPSMVVQQKDTVIIRVQLEMKENPEHLTLNQLLPNNDFGQEYKADRYIIDIATGTPVMDVVLDGSKYRAVRAFVK